MAAAVPGLGGDDTPPRPTTFILQKLSLTSSHGGSPPLVNTKERNGSLSLACASPEEPEEPDARVRGTLESGEEDGEVQPRQSIPLPAARLHLAGGGLLIATLGWLNIPPMLAWSC